MPTNQPPLTLIERLQNHQKTSKKYILSVVEEKGYVITTMTLKPEYSLDRTSYKQ